MLYQMHISAALQDCQMRKIGIGNKIAVFMNLATDLIEISSYHIPNPGQNKK
jgi:hypothetical protein